MANKKRLTFRNSPLVELVAELRWVPGGAKISANDPTGIEFGPAFLSASSGSDTAMRFAALVGADGFQRVESLYPPGMPVPPFQVRHRYRRVDADKHPELYQLGHGVFTANMIPPYSSWDDFRPVVKRGIQYVLKAHEDKPIQGFVTASLRYIDCFTTHFTGERTPRRFMEEILGIKVVLPPVFEQYVSPDGEPRPNVQVVIPLRSGHQATIVFAQGHVGDRHGVLMDTNVEWQQPVGPTAKEVMEILDEAHEFIYQTFIELTAKLREEMRPA